MIKTKREIDELRKLYREKLGGGGDRETDRDGLKRDRCSRGVEGYQ